MILDDSYPIVKVNRKSGAYHWILITGAKNGEYTCMDPIDGDEDLSFYNDTVYAVRTAVRLSEIAAKAGMKATSASAYLNNLQKMRIVEKITPCGEKESGKKSQYVLTDNFFSF